jgi:hypothetical protein
MTVSLKLASIADAISAISISGVTVKDKDQIAASWVSTPNVLYPNPDGWITNFSLDYVALMQGTTAPMDISYTLNYRFLGVQVGDLSIFPTAYSSLVDKLILIVNAVIAVPAPYSGTVELKLGNINIGARTDPTGNNFFGADLSFLITEQQN